MPCQISCKLSARSMNGSLKMKTHIGSNLWIRTKQRLNTASRGESAIASTSQELGPPFMIKHLRSSSKTD